MKRVFLVTILTIFSTIHLSAFDHLNSVKEFEEVTKKGDFIIDFYASWCSPCKEMEENLKELSSIEDGITIYKVNIEKSVELLEKYGTPNVPALLYIRDGEILQGYVGLKHIEELKRDMKKYFIQPKG